MRILQCPWCGKKVDEANHLWDQVVASGTCPFCKRFYDRAKEADALREVASRVREPGFAWQLRRARIRALGEALVTMFVALIILAAAFLFHFHLLFVGAVTFMTAAIGRFVWAVVVNPERHVRGRDVGKITAANDADRALLQAAGSHEPADHSRDPRPPQERT